MIWVIIMNSVLGSAQEAYKGEMRRQKLDSPIGGLKCDRTVDKAVDLLDKKQDYYTTEEECTSEHGLRGHVRAHPEAAFVNIQEENQCSAVIWQQCGVKTSPEDVIVVQMETGLTVPSAEKTPLIFKGSYGGEEYRKEGTEHSENSLVVKSSISSMSSTSAAISTDFCCCSIDNITSPSSTPSSFSVESPDSNTSNPGGLLNLESSHETHLIISAGNKPEEVRCQPVVREKAKFDKMSTASYTDAILKKLACYARATVSLNSHQNLTSQNDQNGAKKISSQEESWALFDYFMDFLASQPKRLDLDMIKTHKLHVNDAFGEFSMETNSVMAHVKCVDSRLGNTNNSLLPERQPKLQGTDTGDSNWELAKQDSGQHSQPNIIPNSEISSQVIGDQFWEKGNSLTCCCNSPRKHLSSFKLGTRGQLWENWRI